MLTPETSSVPIATPLVIGVTSHRNIPAREAESIRQRVQEFFAQLQHDFPELPLVVVSALAEGGDQLVAQEALDAGARLIAPLPLPLELYADDFHDPQVHATFTSLCARAQVINLPLLPDNTAHGICTPGPQRDRQYGQAGVFIARHCHLLLAIWDGKPSKRLGGTAQVVEYYLTGTMPGLIERRADARRHLLGLGDERLVCQIACSRDTPDGAPRAPLHPGEIVWRTLSNTSPANAAMPPAFRTMFKRTAAFNADWAKYQADIDQRQNETVASPLSATDRLFQAADWLAIHFSHRVLLAMRTIYTLAALMAIAFNIYDNVPDQDSFIYVFLLLFAAGVLLSAMAKRRDWHRKYLDYRALAEGLRVQSYWQRAGISLTGDPEFAQDSFLQKQDIELGWTRNVMRSVRLGSTHTKSANPATDLQAVIHEWVGDADHAGQLDYFAGKAAQRTRQLHITEAIGRASLYIGIGISVMLAVLAHWLSADTKNAAVIAMATFSILAAVREAYAYKKADKELIKQYRFMQRIFTAARSALEDAADATEQRHILRSLGETALAEHAEWAVMHRQRPLEHGKF
ncbi:MAG: hypothetical protein ABIU96_00880 [Rhodanobacter sp.]